MSGAHTPGPWSAPSAAIYAGPIVGRVAQGPKIAELGTVQILKSRRAAGLSDATIAADARLMAAAPAMLAALRQIATFDPEKLSAAALGNIARAAIAQAQGEEV
jgi:hypothetical protein